MARHAARGPAAPAAPRPAAAPDSDDPGADGGAPVLAAAGRHVSRGAEAAGGPGALPKPARRRTGSSRSGIGSALVAAAPRRRGAQSADVAALQVALRARGPLRGTVDGGRGPQTTAGVRRSRRAAGSWSTASRGRRRAGARRRGRPRLGSASAASGARGWDVAGLAVPARPPRLPVRPGRRRARAAHRRGAPALPGRVGGHGATARVTGDPLWPLLAHTRRDGDPLLATRGAAAATARAAAAARQRFHPGRRPAAAGQIAARPAAAGVLEAGGYGADRVVEHLAG